MEWKLAEAKNKFSELINRALSEGPQRVQRRSEAVFVVSEKDYSKLTGEQPSFKAYLTQAGPSMEGLDLTRDSSPTRKIEL
jgi:antitoxin Phd